MCVFFFYSFLHFWHQIIVVSETDDEFSGVRLEESEINTKTAQTVLKCRSVCQTFFSECHVTQPTECTTVLEFSRGPCWSGRRNPVRISATVMHLVSSRPAADYDLYPFLSSLVNTAEHIMFCRSVLLISTTIICTNSSTTPLKPVKKLKSSDE